MSIESIAYILYYISNSTMGNCAILDIPTMFWYTISCVLRKRKSYV